MESRQTFLKLELPSAVESEVVDGIFIQGTWFQSRFYLSLTDGLHAWICDASEEEVRERAEQWDQEVSVYIAMAERYLGFLQPESTYGFTDAGNGYKRLSWTFEKEGTKLEWRWKCEPSPNNKKTTSGILDFLVAGNTRLSEEVAKKTQSFERLKVEAEKCLAQSERISSEKMEFESAIYAKFLGVLNSKKAKLRQLRDELSEQKITGKSSEAEDYSTEKTESHKGESDAETREEEASREVIDTAGSTSVSRGNKTRGRKRKITR